MFPGPYSTIIRNEAGEPLGWDNHYPDEDNSNDAYDEDDRDEQEPYCDYCEQDGHFFRSCPKRDDADEYDEMAADDQERRMERERNGD